MASNAEDRGQTDGIPDRDIWGLLGMITLPTGPYLLAIADRRLVGDILGHKVWEVRSLTPDGAFSDGVPCTSQPPLSGVGMCLWWTCNPHANVRFRPPVSNCSPLRGPTPTVTTSWWVNAERLSIKHSACRCSRRLRLRALQLTNLIADSGPFYCPLTASGGTGVEVNAGFVAPDIWLLLFDHVRLDAFAATAHGNHPFAASANHASSPPAPSPRSCFSGWPITSVILTGVPSPPTLVCTRQSAEPEFWTKPLHARADERFVWNQHLLRPFAALPEVGRLQSQQNTVISLP